MKFWTNNLIKWLLNMSLVEPVKLIRSNQKPFWLMKTCLKRYEQILVVGIFNSKIDHCVHISVLRRVLHFLFFFGIFFLKKIKRAGQNRRAGGKILENQ